jgi:hypothetical protein
MLGVGDGGRGVRYRTSFLPNKIAQVLVEWNSGHFQGKFRVEVVCTLEQIDQ